MAIHRPGDTPMAPVAEKPRSLARDEAPPPIGAVPPLRRAPAAAAEPDDTDVDDAGFACADRDAADREEEEDAMILAARLGGVDRFD